MRCVGDVLKVSGTLTHTAPEATLAWATGSHLAVQPSLDVWALGVTAFECITGTTMEAFYNNDGAKARAAAAGEIPYPWEGPEAEQPSAWVHAQVRGVLSHCLSRDSAARPTAAALVTSLSSFGVAR